MEKDTNQKPNTDKIIFIAGALLLLALVVYRNFSDSRTISEFTFSGSGEMSEKTLEEANPARNSRNHDWWLNSGGLMLISQDTFSTNQNELSKEAKWRKLYAKNNPIDTEKGRLPQNVFRLVNRYAWLDYVQSVYFKIEKINLTDSPQRNGSNGVLLFNRYQDGDNLYYVGIRVDGHAVIKKKIEGKYYTLKEKPIFKGNDNYDREDNPVLLPLNSWVGIRCQVENIGQGEVRIRMYLDKKGDGDWQLILETTDRESQSGVPAITSAGSTGIRSDFMDVTFKDYSVMEIN